MRKGNFTDSGRRLFEFDGRHITGGTWETTGKLRIAI